LNQENINNLNRSIASNEIETIIKNLPTKRSPGPDGFIVEFHQNFIELTLMLLKLFHKGQKEGILASSFYKASVTLIPKPGQDASRKKKVVVQYP
jgi:hypothetical protein